jgi:hypothetical protein
MDHGRAFVGSDVYLNVTLFWIEKDNCVVSGDVALIRTMNRTI